MTKKNESHQIQFYKNDSFFVGQTEHRIRLQTEINERLKSFCNKQNHFFSSETHKYTNTVTKHLNIEQNDWVHLYSFGIGCSPTGGIKRI